MVALASLALAASASAQLVPRPPRPAEPTAYASVGIGYGQYGTVNDGTTGSTWNFTDAPQWRVTLERALGGGTSFGVAGTFARVPLVYSDGGLACGGGCDADAQVMQFFASLHNGSSRIGTHQVLELNAGTTIYSAFRERASGARIGPSSDADIALAFGYGFGYTLSPSMQVELVQDLGMSIHQRTGLSAGTSAVSRFSNTRITLRLGLGG